MPRWELRSTLAIHSGPRSIQGFGTWRNDRIGSQFVVLQQLATSDVSVRGYGTGVVMLTYSNRTFEAQTEEHRNEASRTQRGRPARHHRRWGRGVSAPDDNHGSGDHGRFSADLVDLLHSIRTAAPDCRVDGWRQDFLICTDLDRDPGYLRLDQTSPAPECWHSCTKYKLLTCARRSGLG